MAVTSGFFNSKNHDRKYDATQMSSLFEGIIKDGVFQSVGNIFKTAASTGMTVTVDTGRAWFNNTWTNNDALIVLTVPAAEQVLKRIDAVVLEVNLSESVRANSIKIKKGTPASTPSAPAMTKSDEIFQYPLAYITVNANATAIKQANIQNKVGSSACPFVTGLMEAGDIDNLIAQWESQFNVLFAELEEQISQATSGTIIDGSVTRAKLAKNALYSPVNKPTATTYAVQDSDVGKTIVDSYANRNSAVTWTISKAVLDAFNVGTELAFARTYNTVSVAITLTGARVINRESGQVGGASATVTFKLPEKGSMCALKKVEQDNSAGSFWILTGDVEVVS